MKKLLVLLLCLGLCGCMATISSKVASGRLPDIGMTKKQVYNLIGSPGAWTRQVINGKVYETYFYNILNVGNYDFVDGVVVGYSGDNCDYTCLDYYSADGVEKSSDK